MFVSASLGDDANSGTVDRPVKTFARALQVPQAHHIYACAEPFEQETLLSISTDVEIWGGFDCHDGWRDVHHNRAKRTILRANPYFANLPPVGVESKAMVTLADLDIEATAAKKPGDSSIAMLAAGGAEVELCRSALVAGHGADSATGVHSNASAAREGTPGEAGSLACSKDILSGGSEVITACDNGESSIGGAGGDGFEIGGGDGYQGLPEPSSNPFGYGLGGGGERTMPACLNGDDGLPGKDGEGGLGAQGRGTLTSTGWSGVSGNSGGSSSRGQGGGGGGASRGGAMSCGTGPSGGSGGAPSAASAVSGTSSALSAGAYGKASSSGSFVRTKANHTRAIIASVMYRCQLGHVRTS